MCPGYNACYVDQISRHLTTWFEEYRYKHNEPVRVHFDKCTHCTPILDVEILASIWSSLNFLLTLEALHIREMKVPQPGINHKVFIIYVRLVNRT